MMMNTAGSMPEPTARPDPPYTPGEISEFNSATRPFNVKHLTRNWGITVSANCRESSIEMLDMMWGALLIKATSNAYAEH